MKEETIALSITGEKKAMGKIKDSISGHNFIFYTGLLLMAIIVIVWLVVNRRNLNECFVSYRIRNREVAKVNALQSRLENLSQEKCLLEGAENENEVVVRNRFRMVKPGEHLILVEREEPQEAQKGK